jgi:quinol monooxygenase YgiN
MPRPGLSYQQDGFSGAVDGYPMIAPRLRGQPSQRSGRMILINIKMPIRPDKINEWLALADSYAKDVNSEDGCLFFQFARSLTDENEFICIEGFTDAEAGATHVKQPYVKRFFDTAPDLVSAQPQIIYIDTPHDGFGPMGEIQPR